MIYLDHAAATPVDSQVLLRMRPYFTERCGNPSSIYKFGREAKQALAESRDRVAVIIGCSGKEIIFTGSGTEANNLAIFGIAQSANQRHIVTTKIEHDSVLKPLEKLEREGFEVTYLDVGENGIVDVTDVKNAIRDDTILVSIMYANNEIGTIQPLAEIAAMIRERNKLLTVPALRGQLIFHTDACQAAGYLDVSAKSLGIDLMTLNAGKIYGPKGAGCLYIKEGVTVTPQIYGGGQEFDIRSGTENIPAIVGFAAALQLAVQWRNDAKNISRVQKLRDRLIDGIAKIPESRLNGDRTKRLANNVNVSFRGLEGETILLKLDELGIAASSGSACTTGSLEPSHVIRALAPLSGAEEWIHSSVRFTLGRHTTDQEIDFVLKHLPGIIQDLRRISPF